MNSLVTNREGRPSVVTELVMTKLVAAFQRGLNDAKACQYAGISRDTFYRHLKQDEEFQYQIQMAKDFLSYVAHDNLFELLTDKIGKYPVALRVKFSMWLLERLEPEEYGKPGCKHCSKVQEWYNSLPQAIKQQHPMYY